MLPLDGVRVVEIGQVLSGPFAGAILADLGAAVIKIEKPVVGDDARQMGVAFRHGDALNFHEFNRGKKSRALDLKSADGMATLHGLLSEADILLERDPRLLKRGSRSSPLSCRVIHALGDSTSDDHALATAPAGWTAAPPPPDDGPDMEETG